MNISLRTISFLAVALLVLPLASVHAQTMSELQETIQQLQVQVSQLQEQITKDNQQKSVCATPFVQNLSLGASGSSVTRVQRFLNTIPNLAVAQSGPGSVGQETQYFGQRTESAVTTFQRMHSSQILAPLGLSAATGVWGQSTRAHANAICEQRKADMQVSMRVTATEINETEESKKEEEKTETQLAKEDGTATSTISEDTGKKSNNDENTKQPSGFDILGTSAKALDKNVDGPVTRASYTIRFGVKADNDQSIYIPFYSNTESESIVVDMTDGNGNILSPQPTSTITITKHSGSDPGVSRENHTWKIPAGATGVFTISARADNNGASNDRFIAAQITSFKWNTQDSVANLQTLGFTQTEWETEPIGLDK